jgi:TPP-dependent indolepyruvate ferredoxin oxidoreductase alpha subunit
MEDKNNKKWYERKVVWALLVVVMIFGVYVIMNPTWITKPKYMLNSDYCEVDSDCAQMATCDTKNIYNYKLNDGSCTVYRGGSKCVEKICTFNNFNEVR